MDGVKISFDFHTQWRNDETLVDWVSVNVPALVGERKPTKLELVDLYLNEKNRYKTDSVYHNFKAYGMIVYFSVFGWTCTWRAKFFPDKESFDAYVKTTFTDEPTGKYFKGRKSYVFPKMV